MEIAVAQKMPMRLPTPGAEITLVQMEDAERDITERLPEMDITEARRQHDGIDPLAVFLKKRQMHLPALGALRRLEGRIGQLLGEPEQGKRTDLEPSNHDYDVEFHNPEKRDFRIIARALDGKCSLTDDEWRQSRRAVVALIKERTREDEETAFMAEVDQQIKETGEGRSTINIPEGVTAEQLCRQMMADGGTVKDAAQKYGIGHIAFGRMRAIVSLADHGGLSGRDTLVVERALVELNETKRMWGPWALVEPIAEKMWGQARRSGPDLDEIAQRRLTKFDYAFGILMQACEDGAALEIPYLSEARAKEATDQLSAAIAQLRTLQKHIKEVHS